MTMSLFRVIIILFFCEIIQLKTTTVLSQDIGIDTIKVEVHDGKQPLPGVNIRIKHTNPPTGSITDINGQSIIPVPKDKKILVLSFMGPYTECLIIRPVDYIKIDLEKGIATYFYLNKKRKKKA